MCWITSRGSPDARHRHRAVRGAGTDHGCIVVFPYDGSGGLTPPEGDRLTLQDFIYSTYNSLLDAGWRMQEIDQMDMLGFLKVRAWNSNRAKEKAEPKQRFIDEVWPGLKP